MNLCPTYIRCYVSNGSILEVGHRIFKNNVLNFVLEPVEPGLIPRSNIQIETNEELEYWQLEMK